uniref:YfhO family protein n=1 Tax=Aliarcobacter sp. TaxID=2321116 RepID=UPI0040477C29
MEKIIIDSRVQSVEILENNRQVFDSVEYVFNNQEWIVNKIPSTHGYNNLGNPWYWYFKNHEFNSRIIDISRNISTIKSLQRKEFINDNIYYDTFTKEIENNLPKYSVFEEFEFDEKFNFKIIKFSVLPNNVELNLNLSSNALISYNVPYAPNWEVYIDGVKDKIIRTNGFFMGVYVSEGTHNITFEYKPYLVYICFFLAYLLFIVSIIANFIKREKNVYYCWFYKYNIWLCSIFFFYIYYTIAVFLSTVLGVLFNFRSYGKFVFKNDSWKNLWKFYMRYYT